jgi:hypothetical protein
MKKELPTIMPPGIRPGENPPFHRLGEYIFQDLCRDLFEEEDEIATCSIYGERGQSQDGIDLLSLRKGGDGIEVGQCKCYKNLPPREIRGVSDKFFEHWDRWSKDNVKRFILFVACDLSERKRVDEIIVQRKRFEAVGIAYEPWSATKIRNKLRPHISIVRRYFANADYWIKDICGEAPPAFPVSGERATETSVVVSAAIVNQLEELVTLVSGETEKHLQLMRTAWQEGREEEPIEWLKNLKRNNALWRVLSPQVKAKVLCFEASLELGVKGNITQAKKLADEAQTLAASHNQSRLRALIAYREDGPEAALKLLEGQQDVESLNLKAAFLLELGRLDECQTILNFASGGLESNV